VQVPHLGVRDGVAELALAHVRRHHALVVLRDLRRESNPTGYSFPGAGSIQISEFR
jgi:hypothetical protein